MNDAYERDRRPQREAERAQMKAELSMWSTQYLYRVRAAIAEIVREREIPCANEFRLVGDKPGPLRAQDLGRLHTSFLMHSIPADAMIRGVGLYPFYDRSELFVAWDDPK